MGEYRIIVNNVMYKVEVPANKPLLWVLRDELGLTGTKYGCGIAQCGACTVHLDGKPVRSCVLQISVIENGKITTIEGLFDKGHPIFDAWEKVNVPQCGYCQTGQIMSAVALIDNSKNLDDQMIEEAMNGNYCRCGTYYRIRKAIKKASKNL